MSEPQPPHRDDEPQQPEPPTNVWSAPSAPLFTPPAPPEPPAPPFEAPAPLSPPPPPEPPVFVAPVSPPSYPAAELPTSAPGLGDTAQFPTAPSDPYAAAAPLPVPYPPAPANFPPVYQQPAVVVAGYGFDLQTGQALSSKSKVVAGLLQLLPGFIFTLGGIGRLYAGNTTIGVVQLCASVVAWASFWCGFVLGVPFILYAGIWLWFVIDGILLLAGRPTDGQGRLLRT